MDQQEFWYLEAEINFHHSYRLKRHTEPGNKYLGVGIKTTEYAVCTPQNMCYSSVEGQQYQH